MDGTAQPPIHWFVDGGFTHCAWRGGQILYCQWQSYGEFFIDHRSSIHRPSWAHRPHIAKHSAWERAPVARVRVCVSRKKISLFTMVVLEVPCYLGHCSVGEVTTVPPYSLLFSMRKIRRTHHTWLRRHIPEVAVMRSMRRRRHSCRTICADTAARAPRQLRALLQLAEWDRGVRAATEILELIFAGGSNRNAAPHNRAGEVQVAVGQDDRKHKPENERKKRNIPRCAHDWAIERRGS